MTIRFVRALNAISLLLGVTGAVATLIVAFQQWYPGTVHKDGQLAILFLGTFLGIVSTATVWQEYRYSRKAKYAEALPYLHQIFLETCKLENLETITRVDEIEHLCTLIANRLAAAFSLITGTKCSICIKVVEKGKMSGGMGLKVATLCRDDASFERESGPPPTESAIADLEHPERVQHWVHENTAFEYIFKHPWAVAGQRCFFSNHLPKERNYKNSSFAIYGAPREGLTIFRSITWPLPYRSTIVAAIGRGRERYEVAGYLAVDSRSRNVFNRRYDPDLLMGIADCLFNLVHHYNYLVAELQQQREYHENGDNDEEG